MLNKLGIKTGKPVKDNERIRIARGHKYTIHKNPTNVEDWTIRIFHKKYLTKFLETVGFDLKHKANKLRKFINSINKEESPHGEGLSYFLQNAKEINRAFSREDLEIKAGKKHSITGYAVQKLKVLELIEEFRKVNSKKALPALFIVTKKGFETNSIKDTIK